MNNNKGIDFSVKSIEEALKTQNIVLVKKAGLVQQVTLAVQKLGRTVIKEEIAQQVQKDKHIIAKQLFKGFTNTGNTGGYPIFKASQDMFNRINRIPVENTIGSIAAGRFIRAKWGGNWYAYKASLTGRRLREVAKASSTNFSIESKYDNNSAGRKMQLKALAKKRNRSRTEESVAELQATTKSYTIYKATATQARPTPRLKADMKAEGVARRKFLKQGGKLEDFKYETPAAFKRNPTRHSVQVDETLDIRDISRSKKDKGAPTESSRYAPNLGDSYFDELESLRTDFEARRIEYPRRTARDTLFAKHMRKRRQSALKYSGKKGRVYNVPYAKTGTLARQLSNSFNFIAPRYTSYDKNAGAFYFKVAFGLNISQISTDVRESWFYSKPQFKQIVFTSTSNIVEEYLRIMVSNKFKTKV